MTQDNGEQPQRLNGASAGAGTIIHYPLFELHMATESGVRKLCVTIRDPRHRPAERQLYYEPNKVEEVLEVIASQLAALGDPVVAAQVANLVAEPDDEAIKEGLRDIRENGGVSLSGLIQELEQEATQT